MTTRQNSLGSKGLPNQWCSWGICLGLESTLRKDEGYQGGVFLLAHHWKGDTISITFAKDNLANLTTMTDTLLNAASPRVGFFLSYLLRQNDPRIVNAVLFVTAKD